MSQLTTAILMILLVVPLCRAASRDFIQALCYGLFLCICMPHAMRLETPGALPELTIQRLVLLLLLFYWSRKPDRLPIAETPLGRLIKLWALIAVISLAATPDLLFSVKRLLDFVLEIFLIYYIAATTVATRDDAVRLLRAVAYGLTVVAVYAVVEKYTGINIVDRFFQTQPGESQYSRDVRATFQHRILLGAGMAMGWPLIFALMQLRGNSGLRRASLWMAGSLMIAACYFAGSRGPWLSAAIAGMVMLFLGTAQLKRKMMTIGLLSAGVLISLPGVLGTLTGMAESTMDKNSLKGGSFLYRFELWRIAFEGISGNPWNFLFGKGLGAGGAGTIDWTLSYRDKNYTIDSWDNEFAYTLYQTGIVGLFTTLSLFAGAAWNLFKSLRDADTEDRDFLVCLLASMAALIFMMSNVHIFARQLYYIFFSVCAVSYCYRVSGKVPLDKIEE